MAATSTASVYLFRDQSFSGGSDTVVCAAPAELVVSVFGGGGLFEGAGLSATFNGLAVFRDESSGQTFLGVWGARKASRFRSQLRESGHLLQIVRGRPPGRLLVRAYGKTSD